MTTIREDFQRTSLGNDWTVYSGNWTLADGGIRCLTAQADAFLNRELFGAEIVSVDHVNSQVSGRIGVAANINSPTDWVRLVCEPSDGWTWHLEAAVGAVYNEETSQYDTIQEEWGAWAGLGPPAGRRTTLAIKSNRYDAYLDGELLGSHATEGFYPIRTSRFGVAADQCTGSVNLFLATAPQYTIISDHFEREEIGNAPNGSPYIHSDEWEIVEYVSNHLVRPQAEGDNQLTFDAGPNAIYVGVVLESFNYADEIGVLFNWVDKDNYFALVVKPDISRLILYQRENGVRTNLQQHIGFADTVGKSMDLWWYENYIMAGFDLGQQVFIELPDPITSSYIGVIASDTVGYFDVLSSYSTFWPAAVLEPAAIENTGTDLTYFTGLSPGRARVHGGNLIYYIPPILETGEIEATGSELNLTDKLQPGRIQALGSTLVVVVPPDLDGGVSNPAPLGSGRYPIGAPPLTSGMGIIDEHGNVLVDENDRVILLD